MRFASPMLVTVRMPGTGVPLGRTAVKFAGSSPASSQPAAMAWPMLPQPTNKVCATPILQVLEVHTVGPY
jgi:hypothetical protein